MTKPVINLDELTFKSHENGPFRASYAGISDRIGAQKLGYNLTVVPPGGKVCPYHNHRIAEEMFLILEGEGTLRFGDHTYPLRRYDVIACPPGTRDVAHQIMNTGPSDLKFLALSTREGSDVCEYPDSNKIGVYLGPEGRRHFQKLFKIDQEVGYFEGEDK